MSWNPSACWTGPAHFNTSGATNVLPAPLTLPLLLLADAVPSWIPIAALGAVLLWAGATYEARLRNLRAIRSSLAAMN